MCYSPPSSSHSPSSSAVCRFFVERRLSFLYTVLKEFRPPADAERDEPSIATAQNRITRRRQWTDQSEGEPVDATTGTLLTDEQSLKGVKTR